jgi:hypothetical protein
MLGDGGALQSDQPGLFGALLIALAGGWAASRILRAPADAFRSLELGFAGAVFGMLAAGAIGLTLGAMGLFAAAIIGGLAVLGTGLLVARRRKRNHAASKEFDTGNKLEDNS